MKNALLLHGTNGNHLSNWLPWSQAQLEKEGYAVWTPDLPQAERPSTQKYNDFIFANKEFVFNDQTILIGHSSGTVAILGLLQALSKGITVGNCYLVGAFKDNLGWETLTGLFTQPFDFEKIKTKAKKFFFIHSDNDPYCPLDHAQYLTKKLNGELIIQEKQKHFSIETMGEKYTSFPFLFELIKGSDINH